MKIKLLLSAAIVAGAAITAAQMRPAIGAPGDDGAAVASHELRPTRRATSSGADPSPSAGGPVIGPDIICSRVGNSSTLGGENSDIRYWGAVDGIAAYSIGTTSCNLGDLEHPWVSGASGNHPVIVQNFYQLKANRFEQIGMSWLKHSFCAVSELTCGSCQASAGCSELGIGCADTYTTLLNGAQNNLGPRSNVNPTTGIHPHPFPTAIGDDLIRGRLQVAESDVLPAQNPNTTYYMEGQYVGQQDVDWGNQNNNVSHRKFRFLGSTATLPLADGPTAPELAAIHAWTGATIEDVQVDGLYHVGHLVTDNGDGTWHYEYAVYNMNSNRAAGSFSVPVPECVTVTNVDFHDVDYHGGDGEGASGADYDGTDWTPSYAGGMLTWSTESHAENVNANALRWATLYNFRFDADAPPAPEALTGALGLFKPGTPASAPVALSGPATPAPLCASDCDFVVRPGGCPDDSIDVSDLLAVLALWGTSDGCDIDGSGNVDAGDLMVVLGDWGACAP